MRNVRVRDAPCWDRTPNVLNALSANCNCERVFASSAKLQPTAVTLKIHFPVPKCLCKQETTSALNKEVGGEKLTDSKDLRKNYGHVEQRRRR